MKKRSGWITAIGIYQILRSISAISLLARGTKSVLDYAGIMFLISALGFITGPGLLAMKNWARVLIVLEAAAGFIYGVWNKNVIMIFVNLFIMGYLSNKKVIAGFAAMPSPKKIKTKKAKKQFTSGEINQLLANAHIGLARVFEGKKDANNALDHYIKADQLGAALDQNGVCCIAEHFISKKDTSKKAVGFYLKYIRFSSIDSRKRDQAYALLEPVCRIAEDTPRNELRERTQLNETVLSVDARTEWAQYYLGLASYLENQITKAIQHLSEAVAIRQDRPLAWYYLGKSTLIQAPAERQRITELFTHFLQFRSDVPDILRKQGEAAFELGNILVAELGGFEGHPDLKDKSSRQKLEKAVGYFEFAAGQVSSPEYSVALGRAYILGQEPKKAITVLKKAADAAPDNLEYRMILGYANIQAGLKKKAKEIVEAVLEKDNTYSRAHAMMGALCLEEQDFEESEKHCRMCTDLEGVSLANQLTLMQAMYHQNKFAAVLEELSKTPAFVTETGEFAETGFCVARSYARTNRHKEALFWYSRLPQEPRNRYYRGCSSAHLSDLEGATAHFDAVIEEKGDYQGQAFLQRGHIKFKQEKNKEAEKDYLQAQKLDPKNPECMTALGFFYYHTGKMDKASAAFKSAIKVDEINPRNHLGLGLVQMQKGQAAQAVKSLEAALDDPDFQLQAKLHLGVLYCGLKEYPKAAEHLEAVYRSGDESDTVLYHLGLARYSTAEYMKALEVWEKLSARHPENERLSLNICRAHYHLGVALVEKERYEEAIGEWEKYLKKYELDEQTAHDLAELHFMLGSGELMKPGSPAEKAMGHIHRAIELDRENDLYTFYMALGHFKSGQYGQCLEILTDLQKIRKKDTRIQYHRGMALLMDGQTEEAMTLFESLARQKNDPYAQRAASVIANEHIKRNEIDKAVSILRTTV